MSDDEAVIFNPNEKFASKAHDLDAMRKSVEDAVSVTTGLWLSYLVILVYIGIATGAVTHKDLFLENPVKLPFVSDVPLSLVAFFILAPLVFIVSHSYTLVHFAVLTAKVGRFNKELISQVGTATATRDYLQWQLPANIFVQLLAGPAQLREGRLGAVSLFIAWASLVIGPIFLLLLIQVQFLPYHSVWITSLHRLLVLFDLVLLWALWPAVADVGNKIKWLRPWRHISFTLFSFTALGISVGSATFPGEWLDEHFGSKQWIPETLIPAWLETRDEQDTPRWTSFHDLLFHGPYDEKTQRRQSLFSNTLVLPNFDTLDAVKIDESKLGSVKQTIIRKNGHFENAIFRGADLRRINLENAQLQGADLYGANLQSAQFYHAKLQGANFYQAKLQCASLGSAQLQGASLEGAQLQGAYLGSAQLQGAWLKAAVLQGAALPSAQLEGASLSNSQLQFANFENEDSIAPQTTLAGVDLSGAAVSHANFTHTVMNAVFKDGVKEGALSKKEFDELNETITKTPDSDDKTNALKLISIAGASSSSASEQELINTRGVDKDLNQKVRADIFQRLACSGDKDAPSIVRGLTWRVGNNGVIRDTESRGATLIKAILAPYCAANAALTKNDEGALERLIEYPQPNQTRD